MAAPLMPKATAVWLVENTSLTFEQIADFCELHPLEIQAIADGEVANQMQGLDPVANGQTTAEEIERCQADPEARLKLSPQALPPQLVKHKGPRYTPIAKRQDKPDAIAFLLKSHPELSDAQISKLIGTTKPTIAAVRDRTALEQPQHQAAPSGRARSVHPRRARAGDQPHPREKACGSGRTRRRGIGTAGGLILRALGVRVPVREISSCDGHSGLGLT